jgi:hypothetical protein
MAEINNEYRILSGNPPRNIRVEIRDFAQVVRRKVNPELAARCMTGTGVLTKNVLCTTTGSFRA